MKRFSLRAPLITDTLFENQGNVFKAKLQNISEGGVLLGELPFIPEEKDIPLLIDIPQYGEIQKLNSEKVRLWWLRQVPQRNCFERKIVRATVKILRSFEGQSEVDMLFIKKVGCSFSRLGEDGREAIAEYVSNFTKNIIFILSLFESIGGNQDNLDYLRGVCYLLGYNDKEKIANLRQKLLHDYQSLESL